MAYATSTYIALALVAASTGTAVYSQQQQAKSQERAAAYNNQLAEAEARNREAEQAEASRRQRYENRRKLARQRAQLAKSGTLTTTGTPLLILGESSANMEIGIADAKRAADMQAAALRSQGQMGLWEADQFASAAKLQGVSTAISGASSAFGTYSNAVYTNQVPDTLGLYRTKATS